MCADGDHVALHARVPGGGARPAAHVAQPGHQHSSQVRRRHAVHHGQCPCLAGDEHISFLH